MKLHKSYPDVAFVVASREEGKKQKPSPNNTEVDAKNQQHIQTVLLRVPLSRNDKKNDKVQILDKNLKDFVSLDLSDDGTYLVVALAKEFRVVNIESKRIIR